MSRKAQQSCPKCAKGALSAWISRPDCSSGWTPLRTCRGARAAWSCSLSGFLAALSDSLCSSAACSCILRRSISCCCCGASLSCCWSFACCCSCSCWLSCSCDCVCSSCPCSFSMCCCSFDCSCCGTCAACCCCASCCCVSSIWCESCCCSLSICCCCCACCADCCCCTLRISSSRSLSRLFISSTCPSSSRFSASLALGVADRLVPGTTSAAPPAGRLSLTCTDSRLSIGSGHSGEPLTRTPGRLKWSSTEAAPAPPGGPCSDFWTRSKLRL
mmetsp:Transcript_39859/g.99786  ORF Transcript_39859/g.99786 Transcript_39859/m.99786 type:complete len:273 (+) Transcript_39859:108-926(+)